MMNEKEKQLFNQSLKTGWRGYEGSQCGGGSNPKFADKCFSQLLEIIEKYDIKKVTELGCGDLVWHHGKTEQLPNYVGYDLHRWSGWALKDGIRLREGFDLTEHVQHEPTDIVIVRDVFIHLTYGDLIDFLKLQIINEKTRYVAFTADRRITKNEDKSVRSKKATRFNPELPPLNLKGEWFQPWFVIDLKLS